MTAQELIRKFNTEFGISVEWPKTYEVDVDTYANCCKYLFEDAASRNLEEIFRKGKGDLGIVKIIIGENCGPLIKNVELILIRGN